MKLTFNPLFCNIILILRGDLVEKYYVDSGWLQEIEALSIIIIPPLHSLVHHFGG